VRHLPNLTILDRTLVDRFEETPDGVVVHAISDGKVHELTAGTLVLAAGVYGTPLILQRSGIGDPERLRAVGVEPVLALPGVGANLHDHPLVLVDRAIGAELQADIDAAAATGFLPEEQTLGKAISSQSPDGLYDLHLFPVLASDQTHELHGRVAIVVSCVTPQSRGRIDITSADPDVEDTLRPACLATRAPAAAATNIDAVEMLNVCEPSPPVPTMSYEDYYKQFGGTGAARS
jgi:choline dehydrogenase